MEQQQTTVTPSSFMTRATGVFASPGEVFQEVASAPVQTSSWMLPYIFSLLITVVFTVALFNNPSLRQQILEPQQQKMQKQVDAGKMSQENYDKAVSMMESPAMFYAFGIIGSVIFVSAAIFGAPLVIWLAVKWVLKAAVPYKKMLEVYGLTIMVGLLGAIITLLLMHVFDNVHASLGGSLLVMNHYDQDNIGHNLLASLGVFGLWQTALVGMGISKVTGKSSGTGMGLAFGLFALWVIVSSALGLAGR
jgi:hypothetical protein